jgi:hypothetical protein
VSSVAGESDETFDTYVTQESDGNLFFIDGDGIATTLERMGTGVIVAYRFSHTGPGDGIDCDILTEGTARLDTRTNTLTGNVMLRELGCDHEVLPGIKVTATKLN